MTSKTTAARLVTPFQLAVAVHHVQARGHEYGDACPDYCRDSVEATVDQLYSAMPPNEVYPADVRVDRRDEVLRLMPEAKVALLRLSGEREALKNPGALLSFDVKVTGSPDSEYAALLRVNSGYTAVDLAVGRWILRRATETEIEAIDAADAVE